MPQIKILLDESEIPTHWYNIKPQVMMVKAAEKLGLLIIAAAAEIAVLFVVAVMFNSSAAAQQSSKITSQTGKAACYSSRLIGHRTTSGQRYDPNALTAAHAQIPIGTHVKVTNLENGQAVVVLVNDHMSAHAGGGIILDISRQACKELKVGVNGEAKVKLEVVGTGSGKSS